jgi:hypothetical protein
VLKKVKTMSEQPITDHEKVDFSLVLGGPLFQLFLRARLIDSSLNLLRRRVIASILITWLPLVVLTAFGGHLLRSVGVPFLYDVDAHAKFLVLVPLLIGAELIVHRRIRAVVEQFRERGLIAPEDDQSFESIIAWAMRLRNSPIVEVLLLVLVFTGGYWFWREHVTLHVATWYAAKHGNEMHFTWAGYWYVFISMPISRFILFRWYFRILIWYLFLLRVSRLNLRLNPLHPDRAGGLGFVSGSVDAFVPVLVAQSAFLATVIANMIWHENMTLPEFKLVIVGFVAFLMLVVLLPLTFFIFQMASARRTALREFGLLAGRYAKEFRQKWLQRSAAPDEPLLGSADIQSLADLANSYDVVREMRLLPFGRNLVMKLFVIIALPLLPLTLTMIPLEEMVDRLMKMLL